MILFVYINRYLLLYNPHNHNPIIIIIGALCGIVVNEVEGFVAENMTEQEIIDTIEQDICSQAPSFEAFCDSLMSKIPQIVSTNTHRTPP